MTVIKTLERCIKIKHTTFNEFNQNNLICIAWNLKTIEILKKFLEVTCSLKFISLLWCNVFSTKIDLNGSKDDNKIRKVVIVFLWYENNKT